MNVIFLLLLGFVGKLLTATVVYNLQQLTDDATTSKELILNSREDVEWDESPFKFLDPTEIKKVIENYSSYVMLDLVFELIKNGIIYVARLYY